MEIAGLVVAIVSAVAAGVAAVVAIVQAAAARRDQRQASRAREEAEAARDETLRLAAESNEIHSRIAKSGEDSSVALRSLAAAPPERVHFRLQHLGGQKYHLLNDGNVVARNVTVGTLPPTAAGFVHPEKVRDVDASGFMKVTILMGYGDGPEALEVGWLHHATGESELQTVHIP